jgi:hypothetical protein
LGNGNILTSNTGGVHEIDRGTTLVETKLTSSGVRMISEIERNQPCDSPGDVPWLSVSHGSGTAPAGGTSEVTVLVNSTGLAAGVHEAHLCVGGNDPDSPLVGVPVTVTVTDQTCTRTITGTHFGPVTVSSGLMCLAHGSVVTGPVRVAAGASLHASGATVIGPVSAQGAARVELLRTVIVGPVFLHGGTTLVVLAGNRVTGPVSLVDNVTGQAPVVVSGNTVVGPLACTGNEPPPVNDGQPNTVLGPATGQCSGL